MNSASTLKRTALPLILISLVTIVLARAHLGDWTANVFVVHGEVFHDHATAVDSVRPVSEGGYDGQFFTRLAMDPFDVRVSNYGINLDRPAYRAQRMLYPLTAWGMAFGRTDFVPYTLVLLNVLSLIALFFILKRLLGLIAPQSSPLYLIIAVLLPGLMFGLGRNLSEPLGIALVTGAFLGLLERKKFLALCLFALACLVRETFCLTVFAAGIWLFLRSEKPLPRRTTDTVMLWSAVIPMLVWQGWLYTQLGTIGPLDSPKNITFPLGGIVHQLMAWATAPDAKAAANLLYLSWHGVLAFTVLKSLIRMSKSGADDPIGATSLLTITWSILTLFSLNFTNLIWEDAWAFCRVLAEWSVCSLLLLAILRPRIPVWFACGSLALTGLSMLRLITRL